MAKNTDSFVEIDLDNLDDEWVNQPKLYFKWASKLADARQSLDEAEAEQELVTAELDAEIRAKPKKYKLGEKPTVQAIKAAILIQTRYTDAQQMVNACRHTLNHLQAGVNALDHKKRALEKLVDLHIHNYNSSPRLPRDDESRERLNDRRNGMRHKKNKRLE
jgi:hypothetical protein